MPTGQQIKRLRGKISAQQAADFIGVDVDRLRKWEQRDADPKDSGDIQKVEAYFGVPLKDLTKLDNFQWIKKNVDQADVILKTKNGIIIGEAKTLSSMNHDIKDEYITLLKRTLKEREEQILKMDKEKIINLLQGLWQSSDKKVSFKIIRTDIQEVTGTPFKNTFFTLQWADSVRKWQITVPHFFWMYSFIIDISEDSFVVYSYDPNSEKAIQINADSFELLHPDRIFKFNRLNESH